jgi:hypothetical protein
MLSPKAKIWTITDQKSFRVAMVTITPANKKGKYFTECYSPNASSTVIRYLVPRYKASLGLGSDDKAQELGYNKCTSIAAFRRVPPPKVSDRSGI